MIKALLLGAVAGVLMVLGLWFACPTRVVVEQEVSYGNLESPPAPHSCAEVWGPYPGSSGVVIPPGWRIAEQNVTGGDFRVWDEHGRLVCDEQGKAVK